MVKDRAECVAITWTERVELWLNWLSKKKSFWLNNFCNFPRDWSHCRSRWRQRRLVCPSLCRKPQSLRYSWTVYLPLSVASCLGPIHKAGSTCTAACARYRWECWTMWHHAWGPFTKLGPPALQHVQGRGGQSTFVLLWHHAWGPFTKLDPPALQHVQGRGGQSTFVFLWHHAWGPFAKLGPPELRHAWGSHIMSGYKLATVWKTPSPGFLWRTGRPRCILVHGLYPERHSLFLFQLFWTPDTDSPRCCAWS